MEKLSVNRVLCSCSDQVLSDLFILQKRRALERVFEMLKCTLSLNRYAANKAYNWENQKNCVQTAEEPLLRNIKDCS